MLLDIAPEVTFILEHHRSPSLIRVKCSCCLVTKLCPTLQPHGLQHTRPGSSVSTISWSLLKFMSVESVMLTSHLIFCRPLLPMPSIFPCIRVFSNEPALHIRWPKYWSFNKWNLSCGESTDPPSGHFLGGHFHQVIRWTCLAASKVGKAKCQALKLSLIP